MKFPITRESLLAYNPVKEAAEKKEEQLQGGLHQMLIQLRNDFEAGMKVYAAKQAEVDVQAARARQHAIIRSRTEFICHVCGDPANISPHVIGSNCNSCGEELEVNTRDPILNYANVSIPPEKKFIWSNLQQKIDRINYRPTTFITHDHIPRFIKMVEENFVGCTVTVDPLSTYIIIDWS